MKTIKFIKIHPKRDDYRCKCVSCAVCIKDHSGRWVKAEVAEGMLECLKKTAYSLENMVDCSCNDDCRPKAVRQLEIAQKTIKKAEEE